MSINMHKEYNGSSNFPIQYTFELGGERVNSKTPSHPRSGEAVAWGARTAL